MTLKFIFILFIFQAKPFPLALFFGRTSFQPLPGILGNRIVQHVRAISDVGRDMRQLVHQ